MKTTDIFPSKYLKASDIPDDGAVFVIQDVKLETFGEEDEKTEKPIIYFKGYEKQLVCNKTNWTTLESLYGDESDNWVGKSVNLIKMEVAFKGKMSMAIRVSLKKPSTKKVDKTDDIPY